MPKRVLTEAQKARMREYTKQWRIENIEKAASYQSSPESIRRYMESAANKARKKAYNARYTARNPKVIGAHRALGYAIKTGKMKRADRCDYCKSNGKVHAHHPDYDFPLWVFWLCSRCHAQAHKRIDMFAQQLAA